MKMVKELLGKVKGEDKIDAVVTGKGSFSKQGFGDLVNAMVNDTTFKIKTYGKDGKPNGEVSISELIRSDLKKTIEKAKYPQKSEAGVLDNAEIVTTGLAEAIPQIVMQQMMTGKKFDFPAQANVQGSIYLKDVPGAHKVSKTRDIKTKQETGTVEITTQDSVQIKAKSSVPAHLKVKVNKDLNGNVINK